MKPKYKIIDKKNVYDGSSFKEAAYVRKVIEKIRVSIRNNKSIKI